eukprot:7918116-Heterocapsa_arctica.AAC.1
MMRLPDALVQPKLDLRWVQGLWLGRKAETDENVVGCRDKIRFGRSVKEIDDIEKEKKEEGELS